MSHTAGPSADGDGDTVAHLRAALETAEDDEVRYYVRQALQHQIIAESDTDEA
jgi:predicted short-subunit dehydrogenase-like oxidoreductase (DUF2520 family)